MSETNFERQLFAFIKKEEGKLLLKKQNGRHDTVFALITKESEKEFEYYRKLFGNVATIYPKSGKEKMSIVVDTNFYPKKILHAMTKQYTLDYVDWTYDQLEAPHWDAVFQFEAAEEALLFLNDIWTLKQTYVENGELEKEQVQFGENFYYALSEKEDYEGNLVRVVTFVEQDDWHCFGEHVYEHYHGASQPVLDVMTQLQSTRIIDSAFFTNCSFEEVKRVLENHPHFEYNENFQQYVNE